MDVPGAVAVTGFDDIPVARRLRPGLTTVRQPIQELGPTAFELLESLVRNREPEPRDVVLPTSLIVRESCGCAGTPGRAARQAGERGPASRPAASQSTGSARGLRNTSPPGATG